MSRKNIEAIYPLTGMQQALLFHSLRAGTPDSGLLQLRCTLQGRLELTAFERAWKEVVNRHSSLRTSVHWQELEQPLQIVLRHANLPVTQCNPAELEVFLREDAAQGLDLSRAPVMRLTLIRTSEDRWHLVWTCHHVLLDGWSGALVLREILALHEAFCGGEVVQLPAARPYRDYVAWLQRQDASRAEAFWRTELSGLTTPTPLPFESIPGNGASAGFGRATATLPSATTDALQEFVRRHRLTLNTLVQGAWALLLSRHGGRNDVVFGSTVSGRSGDLLGLESMVGLFINTPPIRVQTAPDASMLSLLEQIQTRQASMQEYEHVPPAQIHTWSNLPEHQRLFESLIVFENYPQPAAARSRLQLVDLSGGITTNYPLTVIVEPGAAWSLHVIYDIRRFGAIGMKRMLDHLMALLEAVVSDPARRVADLLPLAGTPEKRLPGNSRNGHAASPPTTFVAPRDHLEHRLTEIWEGTLDRRPIGIRDDFFDLGGHSLLAARLFERIERELDRKLPLSALFQISTIEHLATALRGDEPLPWKSLVPIRPAGSKPRLFCIHSWPGNVLFYRPLARHLSADQPVYALQSLGLDGEEPLLTRIEDMAAHYLREIRSLQPDGPYYLTGRCLGGTIAFEMAQQLQKDGAEVGGLIILDSGFVGCRNPRAYVHHPELMPETNGRIHPNGLRTHLRKGLREARRMSRQAYLTHFGTPQERRFQRVSRSNTRAAASYLPDVYPGRITVIVSEGFAVSRGLAWWVNLASGGVEKHVIPGRHGSIMDEPHVRPLAASLQVCLDHAYAQPVLA